MNSAAGGSSSEAWSLGKLQPVRTCPACGSSARVAKPYRIRDYLGSGAIDEWSLWRCSDCASVFLDPRPDDASIPLTYRSYYTHDAPPPASNGSRGLLAGAAWGILNGYLKSRLDWNRAPRFRIGAWLCAAIPPLALKLDYFGRHLFASRFPAKGVLVDIGCGNGEFLRQAAEMGWQAHGIEPDVEAVKACRAQGLSVFEGTADTTPAQLIGAADAVTLSHCIEHVTDPGAVLATVREILKPGGWVWLATPNPDGIGLRLFGSAWRGLEPSRHLCIPSQEQLAFMLVEHGFEQVQLLRRGAHGKTITRESALIARLDATAGNRSWPLRALLGLPTRLAASIAGSLSARWGEETVIVARSSRSGPVG